MRRRSSSNRRPRRFLVRARECPPSPRPPHYLFPSGGIELATRPLRRPLGEKGFKAFAEIGAGVDLSDQIAVVDLAVAAAQASEKLLGDPQGERCMARDLARQSLRPRPQCLGVVDD